MTTATIERVHDPETGRISAVPVAQLYDLRLSQLARVLDESYETLRKSPCRAEAQPGLARLAHAWNQLRGMFANDDRIRRWLHHPLPDGGNRPLDLLLKPNGLRDFSRLIDRMATGTYR